MKEISFDECKKIELDILKDVASFCDDHKLTYFLTYGTLLGAIRHKGFIPWDDDIDISMPRPDYDKFAHLFNSKRIDSDYYAVAPFSEMGRHPFIKVINLKTVKIEPGLHYEKDGELGVDIDIFPIDGQPEDYDEFLKKNTKNQTVEFDFKL